MGRRAGDHGARLTAAALQRELQQSGPGNLRELMVRTGMEDALGRKRLRLLLRGMARTGELTEDLQGRFHSSAGSFRERLATVAVVEARGRDLFFEGIPLPRTRGQRLRGGDRIEAFIDGERVDVLRVLERSPALDAGLSAGAHGGEPISAPHPAGELVVARRPESDLPLLARSEARGVTRGLRRGVLSCPRT